MTHVTLFLAGSCDRTWGGLRWGRAAAHQPPASQMSLQCNQCWCLFGVGLNLLRWWLLCAGS